MPPIALSGSAGEPVVRTAAPLAWAEDAVWAGKLWRADRFAQPTRPVWSSGFAALDAELPGGGWPTSGLTELLLKTPGSGELRLLAPALRDHAQGELLCIAPPHTPYGPALEALGLPLSRLTWIAPVRAADGAWAAEQALRGRCCAAVLWWGDTAPAMLRRLHLVAQDGDAPLLAFRPWAAQQQSSPAPLRITCEAAAQGRLSLQVFKRAGPAMAAPLLLSLPPPAQKMRWRPVSITSAERPLPAHAVVGPAPALAAA